MVNFVKFVFVIISFTIDPSWTTLLEFGKTLHILSKRYSIPLEAKNLPANVEKIIKVSRVVFVC
jgi:hypothetical protein